MAMAIKDAQLDNSRLKKCTMQALEQQDACIIMNIVYLWHAACQHSQCMAYLSPFPDEHHTPGRPQVPLFVHQGC